jgi:hypothetical protein
MKTDLKRRDFLAGCVKAGFSCCALMYAPNLFAHIDDKPDPKKLNYCGYTCSAECPMYKATTENNTELKRKAYEDFKIKEKFGIDFDPDKIFCWGCKVTDKPVSMTVDKCTVRKCAIEKGFECCIQCAGLQACDKELWISYPQFKQHMVELQKKYQA